MFIFQGVIPLLDHRDKTVREEGKKLIIESYRFLPNTCFGNLKNLELVEIIWHDILNILVEDHKDLIGGNVSLFDVFVIFAYHD